MGRKIIVLLIIFLSLATAVSAETKLADSSAKISVSVEKQPYCSYAQKPKSSYMVKKMVIKRVLEKNNSPLASSVDAFIETCRNNKLDCYLLPSITWLESSLGKQIHSNSYNPFGWGGGYIVFSNWDEGISVVGSGLRNNYINRGAETIEEIGGKYAESPTWAIRVRRFIAEFEKVEAEMGLYLVESNI